MESFPCITTVSKKREVMSEIPGYMLEDFIEWQHGFINPELLAKYEPYRERIEIWLDGFDEETQSWRDYASGCPVNIKC